MNNPFKPGAGHMPPYLAGRIEETREFLRLLDQTTIFQNLVLTGLRGVGKTVLLETFKPLAIERGWSWVGTDLSESASITEASLCTRVLTDIATLTGRIPIQLKQQMGFVPRPRETQTMDYNVLAGMFTNTPGLNSDKLKSVLETVWTVLKPTGKRGVVFAYDEAQNLADHSAKDQFPLSLLLDVFQSLQKKEIPFLLALTGLPTLFPKLVDARTFSERMFKIIHLERLSADESKDAINKPIEDSKSPVHLTPTMVDQIIDESGGYPYFIQFICREVFDVIVQTLDLGPTHRVMVSLPDITRKLDRDFFAGRWSRVTDRQRELLIVAAHLPTSEGEFTVQELVEKSRDETLSPKAFSPSHVGQILSALAEVGLVYKNRHGRYLFAVPLLNRFIRRQLDAGRQ
jgi:hypothetical protein